MKIIALTVALTAVFPCFQEPSYSSFGDQIKPSNAITIDAMLEMVSDEEKDFKIKGFVEEVCQMKGCWMTLRNGSGYSVRVTFKDYGFFVPKDLSGKEVIMQGEASFVELEEDQARHYADDAGKTYDPSMKNEISFVASGVLVKNDQE